MKKSSTIFIFLFVSTIFAFSLTRTPITITDKELTVASYTNKEVILNSKTDLHITATTAALTNSVINLNTENSWVFFDNIRPAVVVSSYLKYINVNGVAAVLKTNVRVSIYKHGTVVIPQSSAIQPLQVFTKTFKIFVNRHIDNTKIIIILICCYCLAKKRPAS